MAYPETTNLTVSLTGTRQLLVRTSHSQIEHAIKRNAVLDECHALKGYYDQSTDGMGGNIVAAFLHAKGSAVRSKALVYVDEKGKVNDEDQSSVDPRLERWHNDDDKCRGRSEFVSRAMSAVCRITVGTIFGSIIV